MAAPTANEILTRAMRRIKVLAGEEAMASAELSDGLTLMNGTMHGFNARGINYAHADLTSSDAINMPDELMEGLVWLIAEALASDYGYEFTAQEQGRLIDAKNQLQAAYWMQPPADTEPLLRPWPARYDISTDSSS